MVRTLYYGKSKEIRPRGTPKGKWNGSITEDLKKTGISIRHATNREHWRIVKLAKETLRYDFADTASNHW